MPSASRAWLSRNCSGTFSNRSNLGNLPLNKDVKSPLGIPFVLGTHVYSFRETPAISCASSLRDAQSFSLHSSASVICRETRNNAYATGTRFLTDFCFSIAQSSPLSVFEGTPITLSQPKYKLLLLLLLVLFSPQYSFVCHPENSFSAKKPPEVLRTSNTTFTTDVRIHYSFVYYSNWQLPCTLLFIMFRPYFCSFEAELKCARLAHDERVL